MTSDCIYRRKCGAQRPDIERRSGGYQPTGWSDASSIPPPPTTDSVVTYGGKRMNGHTKIKTAKTIICNMCNEFHSDQPCEPSECEWMQRLEEDADTPAPKWTKVEDGLPENGVDVLCWYEYFRYGSYNRMFRTYGIGYQCNGNWAGESSFGHKARVLAWMPLPNPPKGQKVGCSE